MAGAAGVLPELRWAGVYIYAIPTLAPYAIRLHVN